MSIFLKIRNVFCVALAFIAVIPEDVEAAVLLAAIRADSEQTRSGGIPDDLVLTQARFGYGYDFLDFVGGSGPFGLDAGPTIGLNTTWQLGETGSIDFDENNSAGFAGVVARITDGVDDPRTTYGYVDLLTQQPGHFPFYGAAGTGSESFYTTPNPDLIGNSIDFIRLVVEKVFFDIEFPNSPNNADTVVIDLEARFEFWGSAISVPASGAVWFLMFGALASAGFARFRAV